MVLKYFFIFFILFNMLFFIICIFTFLLVISIIDLVLTNTLTKQSAFDH